MRPVEQIVIVSPQKALLSDCKAQPVGELGGNYETAFYAVSEAYIGTAENITQCNIRLDKARKQIDEGTNDNRLK